MNIEVLKDHPYIAIPYAEGDPRIEQLSVEAEQAFQEFLQLPLEVKAKIQAVIPVFNSKGEQAEYNDPGLIFGYQDRSKGEGFFDTKEWFHYFDQGEEFLGTIWEELPAEAQNFLRKCRALYEVLLETAKKVVGALEEKYEGVYERVFPEGRKTNIILRLLKYNVAEDINAVGHYDKGLATLAVWTSEPGIRFGHSDEAEGMELVPEEEVRTGMALFGGLSLPAETNNELSPGWHDVRQLKKPLEEMVARTSIILFIGLAYIDTSFKDSDIKVRKVRKRSAVSGKEKIEYEPVQEYPQQV